MTGDHSRLDRSGDRRKYARIPRFRVLRRQSFGPPAAEPWKAKSATDIQCVELTRNAMVALSVL